MIFHMRAKVVQTILDEEEYETLRLASSKTGKTLREAVREAVVQWSEEKSGIFPDDPLFRLKAVPYKDRKASTHHDRILYGEEL